MLTAGLQLVSPNPCKSETNSVQSESKKPPEIYTGTRRLVDIVQEYEKLCAKFTWGHKGPQLYQKKCPCNSTTAMYTEWAGWRRWSGAGKWKRPPGLRGRVGGDWLEKASTINTADERGIFSTFLCLLIHLASPQLCRDTQQNHSKFTVDELRLHQSSGQIPFFRTEAVLQAIVTRQCSLISF